MLFIIKQIMPINITTNTKVFMQKLLYGYAQRDHPAEQVIEPFTRA